MASYTAQTYSIDTILQMKQVYTEAPYPGFNLFDICRKKSAAGVQRLQKGENAWVAAKPKTAADALNKTVRGLLNKLTPEKYDEVLAGADISMLLEDGSIEKVVELIFEKALQEPAYAKTYSRFCHDVAMYEVNTSPVGEDGSKSRRSEFRNKIVSRAQREFERKSEIEEGLTPTQLEDALSAQAKRKRANIKFVGQLYLQKVISVRTMHAIIRGIFFMDEKKPSEIDIEVLTELLETIGKTVDESGADGRMAMDDHFEEMKDLLRRVDKKEVKCGARIRFRIMDTIDMRDNGWVARVHNKSNITPATFSEQQRALTTPKSSLGRGPGSPNVMTPSSRFAPRFPESPAAASTPKIAAWRGEVPSSVSGNNTPSSSFPVRRTSSPEPSGAPASSSGNANGKAQPSNNEVITKPSQKLSDRIQHGRREWKDNNQQLDFPDFIATLVKYPGVSEEIVRDVVAHEIVKEACTTTRAEAQDEACKFLVSGIGIDKAPLLTTFGRVLQQAIDEDTAGDVPLFYSRIVKIMRMCAGSEDALDSYRDATTATFYAFAQLKAAQNGGSAPTSPNQQGPSGSAGGSSSPGFPTGASTGGSAFDMTEDYIEELLKVWRLLPQSGVDAAKLVDHVFESRGSDSNLVAFIVAVLDHLVNAAKVATVEEIKKWTSSDKASSAAELKKALSDKFSL